MNSAELPESNEINRVENDTVLLAIPSLPGDPLLDGTGFGLISSATPVILFADEPMADGQTTSSTDTPANAGIVCPFCAHVRPDATGSCPKCTMEDTPTTRRSTGERIGPWFVLQRKNPTAPGLRLSVLLTLARRGHVTPKSIVRGPTTGQFWRYAAQVKGLSRVFGTCWHCGAGVSPDATTCPRCRSAQEIPDDPDQFLETHAALPVMREVPAAIENDIPELTDENRRVSERALPPFRRELPDPLDRPAARELSKRDANIPAGTRSVTLARGEDDVILSASELAAAFQLEMPRQGLVKRTSRRVWRMTKVAALLLVLVSGATATTFYLKPEWYQQARDHARPYWDKTQQLTARLMGRPQRKSSTLEDLSQLPPITPIQLEPIPANDRSPVNQDASSTDPNKLASDRDKEVLAPQPRIKSVWSGQPGSGGSNTINADAPIDALAGQASVFLPTTRSAVTPSQALTDFPNLVDTILTRENGKHIGDQSSETSSAAVASQSKDATVSSSNTVAPSLEQSIAAAAELRTSALDAEARKDWTAAVLIYEQIAKLPEAAHPSDLKVKLAVARDRAKS